MSCGGSCFRFPPPVCWIQVSHRSNVCIAVVSERPDVHSLPDALIHLIVPLGTGDADLHAQTGHRDHDFVDDVVGISDPCNLFALEVGPWVDCRLDLGQQLGVGGFGGCGGECGRVVRFNQRQEVGKDLRRVVQVAQGVDNWYRRVLGQCLSPQD